MTATGELIKADEVARRTTLSAKHVCRLGRTGAHGFPRSIPLGTRRVAWDAGEVEAWLASRRQAVAS